VQALPDSVMRSPAMLLALLSESKNPFQVIGDQNRSIIGCKRAKNQRRSRSYNMKMILFIIWTKGEKDVVLLAKVQSYYYIFCFSYLLLFAVSWRTEKFSVLLVRCFIYLNVCIAMHNAILFTGKQTNGMRERERASD